MPLSFRILMNRGIVYVRFWDHVTPDECFVSFADYMRHPDCRPGQRHLVDLSAVTTFQKDFAKLMALQAFKAEQFIGQPTETMLAYYAPTEPSRQLAALVVRSWEGFDHVVPRVFASEAEALTFLGQREARISDLLAETS